MDTHRREVIETNHVDNNTVDCLMGHSKVVSTVDELLSDQPTQLESQTSQVSLRPSLSFDSNIPSPHDTNHACMHDMCTTFSDRRLRPAHMLKGVAK